MLASSIREVLFFDGGVSGVMCGLGGFFLEIIFSKSLSAAHGLEKDGTFCDFFTLSFILRRGYIF